MTATAFAFNPVALRTFEPRWVAAQRPDGSPHPQVFTAKRNLTKGAYVTDAHGPLVSAALANVASGITYQAILDEMLAGGFTWAKHSWSGDIMEFLTAQLDAHAHPGSPLAREADKALAEYRASIARLESSLAPALPGFKPAWKKAPVPSWALAKRSAGFFVRPNWRRARTVFAVITPDCPNYAMVCDKLSTWLNAEGLELAAAEAF